MKLRDVPKEAFQFVAPVEMAKGAEGAPRRFRGVAYSGLPVTDHPYWGQVVFDLSTTKSEHRIPVLREHSGEKIVGHTESVAIGSEITVDGVFDPTEFSAEVAALSDAGFPWQMSVHIVPASTEEVSPGAKLAVNGREVTGPAVVFRNSRIREVSFVPVGADPNTSAIALSLFSKEQSMTPREQELQTQVETLTAQAATQAASIATLTTQNKELADKFAAQVKDKRVAAIKELFTAIGLEYTEQSAATYIGLDDATFSAVSTQMTALKAKAGEHLFQEQNTGDTSGRGAKSALVLDAERRAKLASAR